jgi:hypothetical protein
MVADDALAPQQLNAAYKPALRRQAPRISTLARQRKNGADSGYLAMEERSDSFCAGSVECGRTLAVPPVYFEMAKQACAAAGDW